MPPVDSFMSKATEEAFNHSVMETITGAAHTTHEAMYFQKPSVLSPCWHIAIHDRNVQSIQLAVGAAR